MKSILLYLILHPMKKLISLFIIFFLFIFIFCSVHNSFSQDQLKIDSLMSELEKANEDTSKIKLHLEIGDQYKNSIPDTALFYYQKALDISENINAKKFLAQCLRYIGIIHAKQGFYDTAIEYFLKSLKIFEELVTLSEVERKKGMSGCYNNIGMVRQIQGSYDNAISYYLKALEIDEEIGNKKGMSKCYNDIGTIYSYQGSNDKAIEYFLKSLKISEELVDKAGMSTCYGNIGNAHMNQGSYDKAIEFLLKASKIFEELGNKYGISTSYMNIGRFYHAQGSYDKAIEYFLKSLKTSEELVDKAGMSTCYGNIGNVHMNQGSYDKAIEYFRKALEIFEELGNKRGMSACYGSIGRVYHAQGSSAKNPRDKADKYDKAIEYYLKSLKIREEIGDKNGIASSYSSIASLNITLADSVALTKNQKIVYLNKAVEYGNKSIELAREIKAMPTENDAANTLMEAYKKLGNNKKAIEFAEVYITTQDSMFSEEKTKALQEMETKYETEKKQQQIELQETQIAKKDLEIKQQKTLRNALMGGLGAFVIIILLVVYAYMQKKKDNIKITIQKDTIGKQKEEITDSIRYAKRIQSAVLPPAEMLSASLPDHFVLFKPKDIVSGDFYWMKQLNGYTIITAVDCTGHGVPGAFMSMLGIAFLNEIVRKKEVTQACDVLNELRHQIKTTLRQEGKEGEAKTSSYEASEVKDGMDMALCVIDHKNMKLQYSGAYNPLYLFRKNTEGFELIETKADRMPIGIYLKEKESFSNHEIELQKDDRFYIFSDGYADQLGGKNGKKFMTKNFKQLLHDIQDHSMPEQKEKLETAIINWMQNEEQVDDILVVGVRV